MRGNNRTLDFTPDDVKATSAKIEAEGAAFEKEIDAQRRRLGHEIQERNFSDVPERDRDAIRQAVLKKQQTRLLFLYLMVKPVSVILGQLIEFDNAAYRKLEWQQQRVAEIRAGKPPPRMVMATRERPSIIPVSDFCFIAGIRRIPVRK